MLLKIDFRPEDVVYKGKGRIVLKLHYYSQFSTGCHLNSVPGDTYKDFLKNYAKAGKNVFVGGKGSISLG